MPTRFSQSIALRARRGAAQRRVALDHLGDLAADGHHRVQARRRLLEDDADAAPAHVAHPRFRQLRDVGAVDVDAAALHAPVVRQQPQDRQRGHRLAAARLADQREGLAALDRQRQRVDRAHQAAVGIDVGGDRRRSRATAQHCRCRSRAASFGRRGLPSGAAARPERARARIERLAHRARRTAASTARAPP